ncbi:phosphoglycerol transferase MdoB-like AlkP superfamily enzyme [Paenibacillus mucilaginosus]|uniref:hypothetical protein n=1 Tax=Paenibacillus mucilaginosus TaxID=61624 RepID=UPI003D1F498F
MNNTFLRCSWGFVYGFIASLIFSAFITIIGNGLAGGGTLDGWGWFFIGLSVPLSITVSIAGYFHAFKNLSRLKFWLCCAAFGFLIVTYMSTVGALMADSIVYDIHNKNMDHFRWGPITAFLFLPLSTFLVVFLLSAFRNFLDLRRLL